MRSGLGQRMAWYIVMNVLEDHSGCLHMPLEDKCRQYPQISLHCPIILKTKHLNLNIQLFQCIVSTCNTNQQHGHIRQKKLCLIIVHYISM
jgi:hypothetical protein